MAEKQDVSTGSAAPICANGCGFYGSAATKNFCSKCYKDMQAAKSVEAAAVEEKKATAIMIDSSSSKAAAAPPATAAVKEEKRAPDSSSKAAAASPVTVASEASAAVKEVKKEEEAPAPIKCAAGCGFFGSAANNNLCSKCHTDSMKIIDAAPEVLEMIKADKAALAAAEKQAVSVAEEAPAVEEAPPVKAAPQRCQTCRKKVGLLGFDCRCGGKFCSLHRHAEKHACEYDFKKADREQIAKNNPLIVAPKINKI